MKNIVWPSSIYKYLNCAQKVDIEKKILDCGAGGARPPLALFQKHGFSGFGIEISDEQINEALEFAKKHNIELQISKGDMREISFDDNYFGFVYSYNSILHLTKSDTEKSMQEFKRVLKHGGCLFVNFLSIDDSHYGLGKKISDGEYIQSEHEGETIHTFYSDDEPDKYFNGMNLWMKEKRTIKFYRDGEEHIASFLEYIAIKK